MTPFSPRSWARTSSASLSTQPRRPRRMPSYTSTTTTSTMPPTPSLLASPPRSRSGSPPVFPSMALVGRLAPFFSEGRSSNTLAGSQSHLSSSSGTAAALKALAAAAPEVAITELDIAGASAADYEAVTQACLDLDNCVGITAWGTYHLLATHKEPLLTALQVSPTLSPGGLVRTRSFSTAASSPRRLTLALSAPSSNLLERERFGVTLRCQTATEETKEKDLTSFRNMYKIHFAIDYTKEQWSLVLYHSSKFPTLLQNTSITKDLLVWQQGPSSWHTDSQSS